MPAIAGPCVEVPPGDGTDPDGFYEEDLHFVNSVASGRPVGPHGADLDGALRTMELAEAIVAAVRHGWDGSR